LAAGGDSTTARGALSKLCSTYWFPIYAFARRQGLSGPDAEDATQGFFAHLLAAEALAAVDRAKGRFRSFLLASMKNFLANERDRARAAKRGGGRQPLSLDAVEAENRYRMEPADTLSPDRLYDRRWALAVLEQVLADLAAQCAAAGKSELFDALKPAFGGGRTACSYAEIGGRLGMSEGAVKVAVHRLRQRYRDILRITVAQTLASPDEVDDELRHLLAALSD
jgi:RNA polymerase sigma-70 factor (ECF subfamily)